MGRVIALAVALVGAYPLLVGYGGPNPFHVAPLHATGDNFVPGAWVESTSLSRKDEITIILMASWCPHCARMLERLAARSDSRTGVDMILFFDDEYEGGRRRGKFIARPEKLAGKSLPYYFAKKQEFEGLYSGFPTILACSRAGCRQKSSSALGLQ